MQLLKKISPKTVMGEIPKPVPGTPIALYRVVGIARKLRYVETNLGQSVGFKGDWRAVRFKDHEQFEATEAFFPPVIQGMLEAVLLESDGDGEIKCAFDIGVKHHTVPIGYEYTVTPIVKPKQSTVMGDLIEETTKIKSLPAPDSKPVAAKK
jgi:hypothetical protein